MLSILGIIVFAFIMALALFTAFTPAIPVILAAWFVGSMIDRRAAATADVASRKDGSL